MIGEAVCPAEHILLDDPAQPLRLLEHRAGGVIVYAMKEVHRDVIH